MALVNVNSAEGLCADLTDLNDAARVMVYGRDPGGLPWNQQVQTFAIIKLATNAYSVHF